MQPPLVLRLIHLKGERGDVYLLTNVLNSRHLSDALASRLYKLRWGIELQFRTLKQTFGRRTLRSRTPDRAYAELEWSLLGLWMIHLFAVKEQVAIGEPPKQTSAAMAIHVVRSILFLWCEVPEEGSDLSAQLQQAVLDNYTRRTSKQGRYRPQQEGQTIRRKTKNRESQSEEEATTGEIPTTPGDRNLKCLTALPNGVASSWTRWLRGGTALR